MSKATIPIEKAKEYILAGNATIIFVNHASNNVFKFKIKVFKEREDMWWVNTLISNPATGKPYFIGTIKFTDFRVTGCLDTPNPKWEFTPSRDYINDQVQKYKDVFKAMWVRIVRGYWKLGTNEKDIYEIMHDGTCLKCGRPLNDPESVRLCFGPDCRKQLGIS